MAFLKDIQTQFIQMIRDALSAAGIENTTVAKNFPPVSVIQNVARDTSAVISLYLKQTAYFSKDLGFEQSETANPCGIASRTSDFSLAPGQLVTIFLGLAAGSQAVNVNDQISCQLTNGDFDEAVTVAAAQGATLTSLADQLATAINAAFDGLAQATADNGAVVVENISSQGFHISTACANTWTINEAVKWAVRSYQIIVWTGDTETKEQIQEAIEGLLSDLDDDAGFLLTTTNEFIELQFNGARPDDAEQLKDIYRDDYLFTLEHWVTKQVTAYGIVATNQIVETD